MQAQLKAVILDMDGVLTQTARLHAKAWKEMFDRYNQRRINSGKEGFAAFTFDDDYPEYVDGVPRYDGVKAFLSSRNIELPYGSDDNGPGKETICGLGNWKNELFHEMLINQRVEIYRDAVSKVEEWRAKGLKTAVISASKNCRMVLQSAGIAHLFDARIDGVISQERNLRGKPDPDIFLEAARELGVKPEEAAILEDSLAGVEAGIKGNFRTVVGVARSNNEERLKKRGAHIALSDLKKLELE